MSNKIPTLLAWVTSFFLSATMQADSLLLNGSFAEQENHATVNWSIRDNKQEVAIDAAEAHHPEVDQALRVDILCDGGSSYGQIAQAASVQPNTVYRFAGDWRSSKGQTAFFQIKLLKDRKELKRI